MAKWENIEQWDFWGPRPRSIPLWVRVVAMVAAAACIGFLFGRDVGIVRAAKLCVMPLLGT